MGLELDVREPYTRLSSPLSSDVRTPVVRCPDGSIRTDGCPQIGGGTPNVPTPIDPFLRLGDVLAGFGRGGGITLPQARQRAASVAMVPARTSSFNTLALVLLLVAVGGGGYWYYTKRKRA